MYFKCVIDCLRPWIPLLYKKLSRKAQRSLERRAKKRGKGAMVIKYKNKRGEWRMWPKAWWTRDEGQPSISTGLWSQSAGLARRLDCVLAKTLYVIMSRI